MKNSFVILLLFTVMKVSGQSAYEATRKVRVDPTQAFGGDVTDLVDSVRYIPLETTNESIFGAISNLQVNDRYFVFFDFDTKALYTFDKGGKFVGKINKIPVDGWNRDNYYALSQFTFNKHSNDIYVVYNDTRRNTKWLLVFNIKGQTVKKMKFTGTGSRFTDRFAVLDDGGFLFSNSFNSPPFDKQAYFYELRDLASAGTEIMPVAMNDIFLKRNAFKGYTLSSYTGDYSVWNRKCEYAFLVFKGNKAIKYDIIFPQYMVLDSSRYKDASFFNKIETVWDYCKENRIIEELYAVGFSGNYLAFRKLSGGSGNMGDNFILSLRTKNLYSFDKISSDEKSFFLPIGNVEMGAFENGTIYNELSSFQMFAAAKERKDAPWNSDPVLSAYFSSESRKSNPVIVALKLKDNL